MTERATGLTEQQYRFAEQYAVDLDSKRAAIEAGYSEASAAQAGSRLLKNPLVQAVIQKAQKRFAQTCDVTKSWVVTEAKASYEDAKVATDFTARLRSLDLLARLMGYFVESTRTVRVIRGVEDLTEDELIALAAAEERDGGEDVRH